MNTVEQALLQICAPRAAEAHKGTFGTVLSLCGSYGMSGAAVLAAQAALRSGAGLLVAAVPDSIYTPVAVSVPEAVLAPYSGAGAAAAAGLLPRLARAQVLLAGCGLGQAPETAELLAALLHEATCPVVLDADGLNLAAKHAAVWEAINGRYVLTPHPAELARLLHTTVEQVQADRPAAAQEAVRRTGAVVVLKGHGTVVAGPDGSLFVNPTGNPGMAVGGSGDVLAGLIAGLVAQGASPADAARCGVYLHGAAGDRAAARLSQRALLPRDMIDELPALLLEWEERAGA